MQKASELKNPTDDPSNTRRHGKHEARTNVVTFIRPKTETDRQADRYIGLQMKT